MLHVRGNHARAAARQATLVGASTRRIIMTSTTHTAPTFADAYRAADVATKAKMRAQLDTDLRAAVAAGDIAKAQSVMATQSAITTKAPTKVETDWSQVAADRIATLRHAADLIESGVVDIDGFPEGWASSNEEGDGIALPEGNPDTDAATRIAKAKVTKSGKVNDIGAAIEAVFADLPEGTFLKVSEIVNQIPGSDSSWGGRVAARLFPKSGSCNVTGVTPVEATATTRAGARKS